MHEVVLAHRLFSLGQYRGRTGHISPGQFQAGEEHLTDNEPVDQIGYTAAPIAGSAARAAQRLQIVPLVADPSQSKMSRHRHSNGSG